MNVPWWAWELSFAAFGTLVLVNTMSRQPGKTVMVGARRRGAGAAIGDVPREGRSAVNFWGALTQTEQHALMSLATRRTFPRGATIFHEGESADHVIVINSGWTKICVRENGRDRLLGERGPGQLVGERAALQPSVRSATVIALDTVDVLVLRTPDFARFIGAHPHVLKIVEDQVYDRLTQRPADAGSSAERPQQLNGHACTIVMTDIAGFNAPVRTASDRVLIQHTSLTMTRDAFVRAHIPWDKCHLRDQGDGLLIVVPPTIPPATVMSALASLGAELRSYNRRAADPVQIRLKAAVHAGPVTTYDGFGLAGEPLVHAARLLDAAKLKQAMADTGALLGVIASAHMYDTVIKDLDVEGFHKVRCKVKESRLVAWIQLTAPALPPA